MGYIKTCTNVKKYVKTLNYIACDIIYELRENFI